MGGEVRVRNCYYEKKKKSITNRVAKFQLREVQGVGIQKKKMSPLYSNNHDGDYQYFFEFYNSYVLDLARFEDHTFAFFKGKC